MDEFGLVLEHVVMVSIMHLLLSMFFSHMGMSFFLMFALSLYTRCMPCGKRLSKSP